MNFSEFQSFREQLLRERSDIADCAETNLYRTLARLLPPSEATPDGPVHRCHLAEAWANRFGLPAESAPRAFISCGVRDSLERLFRHYAKQPVRLWLPEDNYPVYRDLATATGLTPRFFSTLPEPIWPNQPPEHGPEILLITNPLKPLGRWLDDREVQSLTTWLAQSPQRRLLIDAVYTFEMRFHESTARLLSTGKTLLLHSLTKGWLSPRLFGVALVPESDAPALLPHFRENPPAQPSLVRAREFLLRYPDMPHTIACELMQANHRLNAMVPTRTTRLTGNSTPGYFIALATPWTELLERDRLLGLPAAVFGSPRNDITILSSLNFAT